jgi:hypothetical protein
MAFLPSWFPWFSENYLALGLVVYEKNGLILFESRISFTSFKVNELEYEFFI